MCLATGVFGGGKRRELRLEHAETEKGGEGVAGLEGKAWSVRTDSFGISRSLKMGDPMYVCWLCGRRTCCVCISSAGIFPFHSFDGAMSIPSADGGRESES